MGDMADYARELEFNHWLDEFFIDKHFTKLLAEGKWETRDKKVLLISDMTTSHIENSMKMITRSGNVWRGKFYPLLSNELNRRRQL